MKALILAHRHNIAVVLLSMFFGLVMFTVFNVWVAQHYADSSATNSTCELIRAHLDVFRDSPPSTPSGVHLQAKLADIYQKTCTDAK